MRAFITLAFCFFCFSAMAGEVIEIDLKKRVLSYQGKIYPIAAPRPGAVKPIGEFIILKKAEWPSWTPTPNMRRRDPSLRSMRGGEDNPLGARALYLYRKSGAATMFRIHGTNKPASIGTDASSGCIRMLNADVTELFASVPIGSKVVIRG